MSESMNEAYKMMMMMMVVVGEAETTIVVREYECHQRLSENDGLIARPNLICSSIHPLHRYSHPPRTHPSLLIRVVAGSGSSNGTLRH